MIGSTIGNAIAGGIAARTVRPVQTVSVDPDTIVDPTPRGEAPITGLTPSVVNEQLHGVPHINASDLSYDYSGSGSARTITAGTAQRGEDSNLVDEVIVSATPRRHMPMVPIGTRKPARLEGSPQLSVTLTGRTLCRSISPTGTYFRPAKLK